jgi:hypothetical protein
MDREALAYHRHMRRVAREAAAMSTWGERQTGKHTTEAQSQIMDLIISHLETLRPQIDAISEGAGETFEINVDVVDITPREEETARRRSQGAKDGWDIRRAKAKSAGG